jgi:hypothetical protein
MQFALGIRMHLQKGPDTAASLAWIAEKYPDQVHDPPMELLPLREDILGPNDVGTPPQALTLRANCKCGAARNEI